MRHHKLIGITIMLLFNPIQVSAQNKPINTPFVLPEGFNSVQELVEAYQQLAKERIPQAPKHHLLYSNYQKKPQHCIINPEYKLGLIVSP